MVVEFKFEMGDTVKEKVSGFRGIIMAMYFYHTGCKHYGIAPMKLSKEGKLLEWENIDQERLILVKRSIMKKSKPRGGPVPYISMK
jgi:hypothetical protein